MNVYDKAHELARVLKSSQEVQDYRRSAEKVKSQEGSKRMIDDFRQKQMELYSLQIQGKEPSKEQVEAINNLMGVISMNADVREFLESEMRFSRLWQDILKILEEAVNVDLT